MSREKNYKSTTYVGTRKDGSKYVIAQIVDNEINGKKFYRYYYADLSQHGKISNQTVVYSNTNVAYFINERNFGRKVPDGYEEAIDNILFSRENIRDSISKGTFYIGQVRKTRSDNKFELVSDISEIAKSEDDQRLFKFPTKEYTRYDGSTFVVQQMTKEKNTYGVRCYHIFEVVNENGERVVKRNVVYSEQDLLKDNRKGIPDDFLSRDRLDRKMGQAGGYIGYYDQNGIRTYNPKLVQYFKSIESVKVKPRTDKQSESTPKNVKLTPEQIQKKMQWVKNFIKDYEDSEQITSYTIRVSSEEQNIKTILESIRTGRFSGIYDNNAQNYGYELSRVMPSIARLLKEADNLTIAGGEDFLTEFANIPQINTILIQIKRSEEYKQMHNNAETNRRNNTLPKFKKTRTQIDKEYAQAYVLARQEGKKLSKAKWDERIGWYYDIDISQTQQDVTTEKITASDKIDESYITPSKIIDSSVRVGIGNQDINAVIQEMKKTHNRDLQQSYEK